MVIDVQSDTAHTDEKTVKNYNIVIACCLEKRLWQHKMAK